MSSIKKIVVSTFIAILFYSGSVYSDTLECKTVLECAQLAVEKASTATQAAADLSEKLEKEVDALKTENSDLKKTITELLDDRLNAIHNKLSAQKILPSSISLVGCNDPRSGSNNICSCPPNQVLVGVRHFDVPGDDKRGEMVTGIQCGILVVE